jgi:glutamate dehydrogenase
MTDTHAGIERRAGVVDPAVFARRFLAHAGSQLGTRPGPEHLDLAQDILEFGSVRPWGQTLMRVLDIDADITAVDIISVDAPYIVESIWAELERSGRPLARLLHPQIVVARDADGTLTRIYDIDDNADVPEGAMVES